MFRAWLLPVLVSLAVVAPPGKSKAQLRDPSRTEAEAYLRSCSSGTAEARRRCEANRQTFVQAYMRARRGDYQGQRAVARLLAAAAGTESAPTPSSAVIPNRIEACAWRMVIIHADQLEVRDEVRERRDCGRLTESEQLSANLRASELLALIGNAPAVDIALPNGGEGS